MYKPVLESYFAKRNRNLLEGKDTILLGKVNDKFYRVQEYIGLVTNISMPVGIGPDIPTVTLRFAGGKQYKVNAYVDNNIQKGNFVSIYGSFNENDNGDLEFTCRCGMTRLFGKLGEAGRVNPKYIYRFGFGELSKVKKSQRFPIDLEGIEVLEENRLWTYSSNNIEGEVEKIKEMVEEEDTTVDLTQQHYVSIPADEESTDNSILEEQMQFIDDKQLKNI